MPGPPDSVTRYTAIVAGVLWTLVLLAGLCVAAGHPGAINPVIGIGVPATAATGCWWGFRCQDRRLNSRTAREAARHSRPAQAAPSPAAPRGPHR